MPGSIIAASVFGFVSGTFAYYATAFAINMVASSIISKAFGAQGPNTNDSTPNPGNNQQLPPAGDNKLPVVYGTAYVGGIVTDLSITNNNQKIYYVLALSEVTNTESDGTPDTITFGNVYWGGKRCVFDPTDQYKVTGLLDESTNVTDTTVNGKLNIYLFENGSENGANTNLTAIQIMQNPDLVYTWDNTKLMSNCAFAIIEITYSQSANLTGLQQTRFQITNSRHKPGDCFSDYLFSTRYGAALDSTQINTNSLTALNDYCDQTMAYTTYEGGSATQTRFRFDGMLETNNTIMTNMQTMASCCDCLIKFNEITGQWGVIVQSPTYTIAMDINDSNMVSAIQITPIDLASSYNIAEVKFADGTAKDTFNSATFDLAVVNPSLLYPNEPVNKQTISLPLVNNSVRAQYLANRFLEGAREDLQVKVDVNFAGIQLEAGDIVTITNINYGWAAKLFRISQVVETFGDDGQITASLTLMEYNPTVYDDVNVTQFTPAPNTGIGSPLGFGALTAPTIVNNNSTAAIPSFGVSVTVPLAGITQYAEIYYSAYQYPTDAQRVFAGVTAVNPGGNPYDPGTLIPTATLINIPDGDWYFSAKMVNALGTSDFTPSSALLRWRPYTFQYTDRYLIVAYADNINGGGFSLDARYKAYFGLLNLPTNNISTNPADYTWYLATPSFGANQYLLFCNRTNRKFTFATGSATYAATNSTFVPSDTSTYDRTIWSAMLDGVNYIDLDKRTGQVVSIGTSSGTIYDGTLNITNNTSGSMQVQLDRFLNFGPGIRQATFNAAQLTVDIYGRVVGFSAPDEFFFTNQVFIATSGQTVFTITHILGNMLIFRDGVMLDPSEYSETTSNFTLNVACSAGETIVALNMKAVSTGDYYEPLNIYVGSVASNVVTYTGLPYQKINAGDLITFIATGTPTQYTVSSVNYNTKQITFTTTVAAIDNQVIYRFRGAGLPYTAFSRWDVDLVAQTEYTPDTFYIPNGFEYLHINGVSLNEIDYDYAAGTLNGFPGTITGRFSIIVFAASNTGQPISQQTNTIIYSVNGQTVYSFNSNPLSLLLYANGALFATGTEYTATANDYTLTTAFSNDVTLINQQTFARIGAA
jgi:hypothetical protein